MSLHKGLFAFLIDALDALILFELAEGLSHLPHSCFDRQSVLVRTLFRVSWLSVDVIEWTVSIL